MWKVIISYSYNTRFRIHKEFTGCENVYRLSISYYMSGDLFTFFSQNCEKLLLCFIRFYLKISVQ